jgi:hypothetical protein
VGDVVEVEFLDHVEDGGEPYSFLVWGVLAVNGRKHYEILSWTHADPTVDKYEHNEKRWTIVKAAVTRITKMIPAL